MGTGRPHLSTLQCRNFSNVEHKFLSPIESQPGPTSVGFGRGWPALACRNLSICTKLQETWLSQTPRVWYAKQHSLWGIRTRLQFSIYGILNSVPIQSSATGGSGPFAQSALSIQYPASPCQCQFCPSIILPLFLRFSGHFLHEFGLAPPPSVFFLHVFRKREPLRTGTSCSWRCMPFLQVTVSEVWRNWIYL